MYERESTDRTGMMLQIVIFMDLSVPVLRLSINIPECPFRFYAGSAHNSFLVVQVSESVGAELRLRLVDDAKRSMVAQGQVSMYKPPRGHEDAGQIQAPGV